MEKFDQKLSAKIDAVIKNQDGAGHAKLVQEAQQIIGNYTSFLGEKTFAEIDNNPFRNISTHKTLETSLAALSKALQAGGSARRSADTTTARQPRPGGGKVRQRAAREACCDTPAGLTLGGRRGGRAAEGGGLLNRCAL